MTIRENLIAVLENYLHDKTEPFPEHPTAQLLRGALPDAIRNALPPDDTLLFVKGSAGQANWARGPWAAIFDRLVTDSAQRGFYPVYLFAEDMSGVYLSLNQAMTEAKERYRSDAATALEARAENFRAMLGPNIQPFSTDPIDLAPTHASNDTAFYEAGNICSVFYPAENIPDEAILIAHLNRALVLYRSLIQSGGADDQSDPDELEVLFEGDGRARVHIRVERNRKLAAKVKKLKGSVCETCDMSFQDDYGDLGAGFIEAHHKIPFARLIGNAIPLDPVKDFAVLCANCHRMAHRLPDPADVDALRAIVVAHRPC